MAQNDTAPVYSHGPATATPDGSRPSVASAPGAGNGRSGARARIIVPVIVIAILASAVFGYRYWQDQSLYVSTENASIAGAMIQVGSLNAGQVDSVAIDIGDRVARDQVVATVTLPSAIGVTPGGTPKMGFRGTDDQQMSVRSPIDGVVVSRQSNPGDTVAAGQSMITIIDPKKLWVQANVEETRINRVRAGQTVDVSVDSLGMTIPGRVEAVGSASAATFSILPQGNTSGNFTKVTQVVPVKIAIDYGDLPLTLGSSVVVRIHVQQQ